MEVIKLKKKFVIPTILTLAILATVLTTTRVRAEEISSYPPIVQKLADKFNLPVSDVAEVFDEDRDERRAEMFARFADWLDEMVASEKITVDQRDAILDKHEEMQDEFELLRGMSISDRKAKMQELHEEFRSFVLSEGLDFSVIHGLGEGEGFGRHGHHRFF